MLAEFVTALQALVVATVLPQVAKNLHGYPLYGYAFTGYLVAQFILTPLAGAWTDRFGVRTVLLVTYPIIAVGLLFSGSAPTMELFIAARCVEGAAGGMDAVIALSAVPKLFPEEQRSRILAMMTTMWALPAVAGPMAGALIAQTIGWRWAFYAFIPLVALSAALVVPNVGETPRSESRQMDGVKMPNGIAAFFFVFAGFFGADGFVPLYLTHERHQSLFIGGLAVMLAALGWSFSSPVVPRLRRAFSTSSVMLGAAVLLVAGCAMLVAATLVAVPIAAVLGAWLAGGVGIGVTYTTLFSELFETAEGGREGAVTSAALMAALLGMVAGTGLGALSLTVAQRAGYSINAGLLGAFCVAFLSSACLLAIANRQLGNKMRSA